MSLGYYSPTDCYSDTLEVTINDTTPIVNPGIYEISPLNNCIVPNGSLGAYVFTTNDNGDGNPDTLVSADGYSFTWFITSEGITPIANGHIVDALDAISYTVEVKETLTGCTSANSLAVSSGLVIPPNPSVAVTNINTCGGTGTLSANVGGNTSNYVFEWFDGPSIKPVADFTGHAYTVNNSGNYTIRAIENSSGCPSNPITVTMGDDSTRPNPSVTSMTANTFCVNPNGSIAVDGDGSGTTPGYFYQWFLGNNTLSSNSLPGPALTSAFLVGTNPFELGGLSANTYTVIVTESATSCSDTLVVNLREDFLNSTTNVTSLDLVHVNGCGASNEGLAFANVDFSNETINGVPVDLYDWQVLTSCNSVFQGDAAPVGNNGFQLTTQTTHPFGRTWLGDSIDLSEPLRLDFRLYLGDMDGNGADGLTFVMHRDPRGFNASGVPGQGPGIIGEPSPERIQPSIAIEFDTRANGPYDPSADHIAVVINGDVANPTTTPVDIHPTNRDVENGDTLRVTVVIRQNADNTQTMQVYVEESLRIQYTDDVINGVFGGESKVIGGFTASTGTVFNDQAVFIDPFFGAIEFAWYHSHTVSETNRIDDVDTQFICGLSEGDYALVITGPSGCSSTPELFTINRIIENPSISTAITHDDHCDSNTGSIVVKSSSTNEPSAYTYQLYDGHNFTTQTGPAIRVSNGATGNSYSNLAPGDYRIRVVNDDLLCSSFEDIVINDNTTTPTFLSTRTINDNTSCDPMHANGFLSVSINEDAATNYDFSWFDGNDTGAPALTGGVGAHFQSGLDAGFYTVVAEHITTGCETVPLTLEVNDLPFVLNIVIQELSPQTNCSNGNGSLRAYVTNDPNELCTECTNNFAFQWYLDGVALTDGVATANGSIPSGADTHTISGLVGDNTYSVEATHTGLGCNATKSFILSQNQVFPTLTLNGTVLNTGCGAATHDGEITVDLQHSGTAVSNPGANGYAFHWFYSNGIQVSNGGNVSGSSTEHISGIIDGAYKVVATSSFGCTSDTLSIALGSDPDLPGFIPAAAGAGTHNNTVCDETIITGTYNGQITVNPVSGSVSDYTFAWFNGAGTTVPHTPASTTNVLSNLEGGTYTVRILSHSSLCDTTFSVTIADDFSDRPAIDAIGAGSTRTDVSICAAHGTWPNGQLNANVTGGSGNYEYRWYWGTGVNASNRLTDNDNVAMLMGSGSSNALIAGASTANLQNLAPGAYTLHVLDTDGGCYSSSQTFQIMQNPATIDFTAVVNQHNYACPGSTPTGEITLIRNSGTSTYSFEWYSGGSASSIPVATTQTVSNLQDGTYTGKVTDDATACFVTFTVTIQEFVPSVNVLVNPTPQTNCTPPNGTATAVPTAAFTPAGPPPSYGGTSFTYTWYVGTDTSTPARGRNGWH